jgi:hypothetical protein
MSWAILWRRACGGFMGMECHRTDVMTCILPQLPKTELLRKEVWFTVSGPDTADQAVVNAVEGIAAGCAATAIAACSAAIAGTSYTGPGAIGACSGALLSTFKVCILGIKAEAVVGAIVKELNINITTTDNWAPL